MGWSGVCIVNLVRSRNCTAAIMLIVNLGGRLLPVPGGWWTNDGLGLPSAFDSSGW